MSEWTKDDCYQFISDCELFADLEDGDKKNLSDKAQIKTYSAEELIVQRGDTGDSLFVVAEGSVRITLESPKGQQDVSVLEPGDFFGEIGLMTHARRTATVTATSACVLLELAASEVTPLTDKYDGFKTKIARTGAARSQDSLRKMIDD
jgi:CRP-like cAMP-binding protein